MKVISAISTFVILMSSSFSGALAARKLHANKTVMSSGAELAVDITSPVADYKFELQAKNSTSTDVIVEGNAHVGLGVADVAYIYIIDSSSSTSASDGACGTTLDCVQSFFDSFNKEVIADGSAEVVAVIDFDSLATVTAEFQDPSNVGITDAIFYSSSDGDTWCSHALEKAAQMVRDPANTATTTVVVFAGDGECNGDIDMWDNVTSLGEDVTESADILGWTGAIVHSIAVGDEIDCSPYNSLNSIPRNGGKCFSIPDPNALPTIIGDILQTNLTGLEMRLDSNEYEDIDYFNSTSQNTLAAVSIGFNITLPDLTEGDHEVCVRVSGHDTLGRLSQAEDCHKLHIELPETQPSTTDDMVLSVGYEAPGLLDEDQNNPEEPAIFYEDDPPVNEDDEAKSSSSKSVAPWKVAIAIIGALVAASVVAFYVGKKLSNKEFDSASSDASRPPSRRYDDSAISNGQEV